MVVRGQYGAVLVGTWWSWVLCGMIKLVRVIMRVRMDRVVLYGLVWSGLVCSLGFVGLTED